MGSEREKSPSCLHVMLYDHSSVSNVCGLVKHELFGSSLVMARGCALVQDPGGRGNYVLRTGSCVWSHNLSECKVLCVIGFSVIIVP